MIGGSEVVLTNDEVDGLPCGCPDDRESRCVDGWIRCQRKAIAWAKEVKQRRKHRVERNSKLCPECGSKDTVEESRRYSWQDILVWCSDCGHRWKRNWL